MPTNVTAVIIQKGYLKLSAYKLSLSFFMFINLRKLPFYSFEKAANLRPPLFPNSFSNPLQIDKL